MESAEKNYFNVNQSESQFQKQDSFSILSIGEHHHEAASVERCNSYMQNITNPPVCNATYKRKGEDCIKPSLINGNANYLSHQVQLDQNQSMDCISYPLAESCFGRVVVAYGPNAVIYPHMVGIAPPRLALPLDCTEGMPIYVNAKQHQAILRRRQTRAKLVAQNKRAKSRKPYLHESRHLHALKRARGSGGRFLNTKTSQQSQPSTQTNGKNLSLSEPEIQHSESSSWDASTTSNSDVSSVFSNYNIFQHPNLRVSRSPFHIGAAACIEEHSCIIAPDGGLQLFVDV